MRKHWPIIIVFLLGWGLRMLYVSGGHIVFGFDQARDAFAVQEILHGHLKIQGPPTSTRDFFHGVLIYYAMAPGYLLGHGSPIIAAAWFSLLNCTGILLVYYFSNQLFKYRFIALLCGLFFAVSYEQTQYATYLSNTSLASVTLPLLYIGIWSWLVGRKWGPAIAGLGLGLSIQSNIFLVYHLPVIIGLIIFRKLSPTRRNLIHFTLAFLTGISSILLAEAKFGFPSRNGATHLVSHGQNLSLYFVTLLSRYSQLFSQNLIPQLPLVSLLVGLLLLGFLIISRNRPTWLLMIVFGLFALAPPLAIGGISSPYIDVGMSVLVFILVGFFFSQIQNHKFILILLSTIIITSQVTYILDNYQYSQLDFSIQKTMTLDHQLAAVDYTYQEAAGKPFSINSITAPLYTNTVWSYLYNWHGKDAFGYVPYFHGHDQIGLPGNNLPRPPLGTERYFVIMEPPQGLPQDIIDHILEEEKGYSTFNHKQQFGEITVQNRSAVHK